MLERSEQIQNQIDYVRKSPLESSEEKRDMAKELRMGIELENAKLLQNCFTTISENPNITKEELEKKLQEENLVANPETVGQFVSSLVENVRHVRESMGKIEEINENAAKTIFRAVVDPEHIGDLYDPKYSFKIVNDTPLAIHLELNQEAASIFSAIKENEGSFFPAIAVFAKKEFVYVPLLVTITEEETPEKLVFKHENAHAENNAIATALTVRKVALNTWGSSIDLGFDNLQLVEDLTKVDDSELSNPANQEKIDKIVTWILSQAKDEILARVNSETQIDSEEHDMGQDIEEVLDSYTDTYFDDYLTRWIEQKPSEEILSTLKTRFKNRLKENTTKTTELFDKYSNYGTQFKKRLALMNGVLTQIPIEKWDEHLESTGYFSEAKNVENIFMRVEEMNTKLKPIFSKDLLSESDQEMIQKIKEFKTRFETEIEENSDKPLTQIYKKYSVEIVQLEEQTNKCDICIFKKEFKEVNLDMEAFTEKLELQNRKGEITEVENLEKEFIDRISDDPKNSQIHLLWYKAQLQILKTKISIPETV